MYCGYDISQGNVATRFRCGDNTTLNAILLQIYNWVCFERIFETSKHLAKLRALVHCPIERRKTCL